ncbi:MAG TPA: hypothetical protein VFV86_12585, partial [Nitrososphaeraceae archaeon]|nr:hypothetical protein [Nitrososphaeraceae archaeon]
KVYFSFYYVKRMNELRNLMTEEEVGTYLNQLRIETIQMQKIYYDDRSIDNYNKLRHQIRLLAQALLVNKALNGSTQAILELEKSYKFVAPIKHIADLRDVEEISLDELNALDRKLELSINNRRIKLTYDDIMESYENCEISLAEMQKLIKVLDIKNKSEGLTINGNFNLAALDVPDNNRAL